MSRPWGSGRKTTLEGLNCLDATKLREFGLLGSHRTGAYGIVTWTNSRDDGQSRIAVHVWQNEAVPYVKLAYTTTDHWTEETKDYDYRVELSTSACNYGGVRYWFMCPLYKNGVKCTNRVRRLYQYQGWFGCRQCLELTYYSQNQTYMKGLFGLLGRAADAEQMAERLESKIKRQTYRGRPTRRMRRYLELYDRAQLIYGTIEEAWYAGRS